MSKEIGSDSVTTNYALSSLQPPYAHAIEIEVHVEGGEAADRDAAFDALVVAIGQALDADPTLGGLAFGMTYGRPEVDTEAVIGAPAIKSGVIEAIVEYETTAPLG